MVVAGLALRPLHGFDLRVHLQVELIPDVGVKATETR